MMIPQGERKVRELKLSATLLKLILCLFVLSIAAAAFLTSEYLEHRNNLSVLAELKMENHEQGENIRLLAEKVGHFEKRIAQLNDFDRKIRIISNLEVPDEEDERLFGIGGAALEEENIQSRLSNMEQDLIEEIHRDIDQLLEESSARERSFQELVEYLKTQKSVLARTPSIWPVMGWVTSEYGYRASPFTERREFHNGIDIAARQGKEVIAPADGVVSRAAKDRFLGNLVWIDHGDGVKTLYGHLHKHNVKSGDAVRRGDVVGYVGNTGRSTGPHLHYSVMINGKYVNPRRYLF